MITMCVFKDMRTNKFGLNVTINHNRPPQDAYDGEVFSCELDHTLVNFGLGGNLSLENALALRDFLNDHLEPEKPHGGCKL